MTMNVESLTRRFAPVFAPEQATVLAVAIDDAYNDLVKADDFNELKEIMRGLAKAQVRTEKRVEELAHSQQGLVKSQQELAQSQQGLAQSQQELAQSQQGLVKSQQELAQSHQELAQSQQGLVKSQQELAHSHQELAQSQQGLVQSQQELAQSQQGLTHSHQELAQSQQGLVQSQQGLVQSQQELVLVQQHTNDRLDKLIDVVSNLAQEMGGLSRSVSYSLENEAYRLLPAFLEAEYGIVLGKRAVRTVIGDEEIDLFALGQRDGVPIVLVGETKLQLDRRRGGRDAAVQVLEQLARKAEIVQPHYPEREVVRLLVTHFARPAVHAEAQKQGVIIAQSFEW